MSKTSQLREKAQTLLKKGKTHEAVEAYKKLLQTESRNPNLYNELGDIYLRMDDKIQAVSSLEKAVANYEKVALYNNAVAVCKKILRVVPNRIETIYKLGELKAKQKFDCEASRVFVQYFSLVTADTGATPQNVQEKVKTILELLPEDDEVHIKAAEVLSHVGMKIVAAEILAKLIVRSVSNGNDERRDLCRSKLDLLRQSLSADEQTHIEEILAETLEDIGEEEGSAGASDQDEPDLTVEEIDNSAAAAPVEAAGGESAGPAVSEEEPAAEAVADDEDGEPEGEATEDADSPEENEIQSEPAKAAEPDDGEAGAEPADTEEDVPTPAEEAAREAAVDEADTDEAAAKEYEIPVQPDSPEEHIIDEARKDEDTAGVDVNATISEDLSDILEAEDEANEAAVVDTEKLAEEITSDVEENDFRSHYDLGMAYIEMALYNEAIRELQISARSEQLQLRSLEMIGHCFLLLDNPRLAVKQLNRGLEIAMTTGGDNLGIHYNLGLAFELLGDPEKAREHFEEVYIVDVTFRDISEKMKKYSTVS